MLGRILLFCFIALAITQNAIATSSAGCSTPEECKRIMSHHFQVEYRSYLISFLKECLYALEYAIDEIRKKDTADQKALDEGINTIKEQREILENEREINNEKLANVIVKIRELWMEIQVHVERGTIAVSKFMKNIFEGWETASIVARTTDTTKLPEYESIDAEVKKIKDTPITKESFDDFKTLSERILQFFGVDKSLFVFEK